MVCNRVIGLLGAAFALASCGSPTETAPTLQAEYRLASWGGEPLPVNTGPLPPGLDGTPSECDMLLTDGFMSFDLARRTFYEGYELRKSCDGRVLSTQMIGGRFVPSGSRVTFEIRDAQGVLIDAHSGVLDGDSLLVDGNPPRTYRVGRSPMPR